MCVPTCENHVPLESQLLNEKRLKNGPLSCIFQLILSSSFTLRSFSAHHQLFNFLNDQIWRYHGFHWAVWHSVIWENQYQLSDKCSRVKKKEQYFILSELWRSRGTKFLKMEIFKYLEWGYLGSNWQCYDKQNKVIKFNNKYGNIPI